MNVVKPFFSVVIPYFNRYELAVNTIRSVLKQSYTNFEIIVVDDGSTDGSGMQLEKEFRGETNFRIFHCENRERGAARNFGFHEAAGEYVVFLDSDDLFLENHLEVLYSKILEQDFPAFIATQYEFLRNEKRYPSSTSILSEGYYDYHLFLEGNPLACHVCIRKSNSDLKLFEEDRAYAIKEDWMFFLQNLWTQRLFLVGRVTVLFRDHAGRSLLANNQLLIEKTFLSERWILEHVPLNLAEQKLLDAHVNYFCAIHSYLDLKRKTALNFLKKAFYSGGIRMKYLVLLVKIIIGRKFILKLHH